MGTHAVEHVAAVLQRASSSYADIITSAAVLHALEPHTHGASTLPLRFIDFPTRLLEIFMQLTSFFVAQSAIAAGGTLGRPLGRTNVALRLAISIIARPRLSLGYKPVIERRGGRPAGRRGHNE